MQPQFKKILLWVSIIIVVIVAIQELFWIGKSDLAIIIIALAMAIGLQSVYLILRT